jgi:hypothetical protein
MPWVSIMQTESKPAATECSEGFAMDATESAAVAQHQPPWRETYSRGRYRVTLAGDRATVVYACSG